MSDRMKSTRITVRIGVTLERKLRKKVALTGKDEPSIIREALEEYLSRPEAKPSAYDIAVECGLVGSVRTLHEYLSTNPDFRGFGIPR